MDLQFPKLKNWKKWKESRLTHFGLMIFIAIVYVWSILGTKTSLGEFVSGLPYMADFVSRMFPPDFGIMDRLLFRAGETIQIAIMGVTFGSIVAMPLSFLAARNVMPSRVVYHSVRSLFDICRGVNEIVWALLFVSMVGLGPFPGVLALSVHVTGALGKYFSEAIENVNPEIVNGIIATGANKIQVIAHGIIPQIKPLFIGYFFYYFEHNIRAATVLGLVGAGGIGIELITSLRLFKYQEVSTIVAMMLIIVIAVDRLSAYVRKGVLRLET
jgi:phosphonate transport system permease protein